MRNSSESESDRADDDIEKLHEIWKNLKQNKG